MGITQDDSPTDDKRISKELEGLIETWCDEEASHKQTEEMILEKAIEEGIDNFTLRNIWEQAWRKKGLSDRTMFRRLPDKLKSPAKQEAGKKGGKLSRKESAVIVTANDTNNHTEERSKPIEIPPRKEEIKEVEPIKEDFSIHITKPQESQVIATAPTLLIQRAVWQWKAEGYKGKEVRLIIKNDRLVKIEPTI